jgi:type IV pilus assembly protein PilA
MKRRPSLLPWLLRETAEETDLVEEEGAESGFTLIELMVVLLIMAILLAIAIPTFLGVKSSAQDRSAQSDLTNAITSAKAVYTQGGYYSTGPAGQTGVSLVQSLQSTEPELNFTTTAVTFGSTPHNVGVNVDSTGNVLILTEESQDTRCWYAEDNEFPAGTATLGGLNTATYTTAQGVRYAGTPIGQASCSASAPPASINSAAWGPSYPA